jgi:hypothetical protein
MEEKPKKKTPVKKILESSESDSDKKINNYKKPMVTFTDKLSKKDITEMLTNYEKIYEKNKMSELDKLELGSHIRYFETVDGVIKFRLGGNVIVKTGLPTYLVLTNGSQKWSIQMANCDAIFKLINVTNLRIEYTEKIQKKDQQIEEMALLIKKLKKDIVQLKKQLK